MPHRPLLAAFLLLAGPALADSQSSNSSSNCSNGVCTRLESLVIEDRRGVRGWVRQDAWQDRTRRHWIEQDRRRGPRPWLGHGRDRDDDDDDDD